MDAHIHPVTREKSRAQEYSWAPKRRGWRRVCKCWAPTRKVGRARKFSVGANPSPPPRWFSSWTRLGWAHVKILGGHMYVLGAPDAWPRATHAVGGWAHRRARACVGVCECASTCMSVCVCGRVGTCTYASERGWLRVSERAGVVRCVRPREGRHGIPYRGRPHTPT